jgi:hypothetical protein
LCHCVIDMTEYVYVTVLKKKSIIVRNNVKNNMIKSFIRVLNTYIKERQTSIVHAYSTQCPFTIPQYDKGDIDKFSKAGADTIPCLSTTCEWLEYQSMLNASTTHMWLLPAVTCDGVCHLCLLERRHMLDLSKIRRIGDDTIVIL